MIDKSNQYDQLGESLSRLLDDVADKSDIARVLECEDLEWQERMRAYALTHSIMHSDDVADFADVNLVANIRAAIDQPDNSYLDDKVVQLEPHLHKTAETETKQKSRATVTHLNVWKRSLGGAAIAASVAFVVISGGSYLMNDGEPAAVAPLQASINPVPVNVKPIQQVSVELDNKRLQNYLRQHAEQSTMAAGQSMLPMARVVGYPAEQE